MVAVSNVLKITITLHLSTVSYETALPLDCRPTQLGRLLGVDQRPVLTCPHCGESYLATETLHHIEQAKSNR